MCWLNIFLCLWDKKICYHILCFFISIFLIIKHKHALLKIIFKYSDALPLNLMNSVEENRACNWVVKHLDHKKTFLALLSCPSLQIKKRESLNYSTFFWVIVLTLLSVHLSTGEKDFMDWSILTYLCFIFLVVAALNFYS